MSLARQIVTLLDLAQGPLDVRTMVAQIAALGGDADGAAVHRRMHQMKAAGQARREGDGWVLVDGLPLQNLRAKWAREGQPAPTITQLPVVPPAPPTLRERIVSALREKPGSTAQELADRLGGLSQNEPASTLNILCKQKRVRHEGEWPARRYFACDGERVPIPRKRKNPAPDSGLTKPAEAGATAEPATPERVEKWLEAHGTWCVPGLLARRMGADTAAVADALEQLVQSGRAMSRFVSTLQRARQYAHVNSAAAQEVAQLAAALSETGPLEDSHGTSATDQTETTAPAAEAPPAAIPDTVVDAALTLGLAQSDLLLRKVVSATQSVVGAAAELSAVANESVTQLGDLIRALDQEATLPHLVEGIATDLEDTIGRACDERADHRAIKALALAAGALRRAQIDLLRAA